MWTALELFLHCLTDSCAIANGDHNKGDKVLKQSWKDHQRLRNIGNLDKRTQNSVCLGCFAMSTGM
jgi:hypothetical protein